MPDIIFLFLMVPRIGKLALEKGLDARSWKIRTILIWFAAEVVGGLVGLILVGIDNLAMINLIGLGFAVASYFTVRDVLQKKDKLPSEPFDINRHVED